MFRERTPFTANTVYCEHRSLRTPFTTNPAGKLNETTRCYFETKWSKKTMRQCVNTEKALVRLRKIEGQIRGIINMIQDTERDVPCDEILIQIGAAKSALHKVGKIVLEGHLQHCVVDGIKAGDEVETMRKLSVALEQFSRIQ